MSSDDVLQISVGAMRVGIVGLQEAIAENLHMRGGPDEDIAEKLLARVRARNYLPASAEGEYKQAFLREFKKAAGEPVAEPKSALSIKILGQGCPCGEDLADLVMSVLNELGLAADLEQVTDLSAISRMGVVSLPALMINGEVRAVGIMPNRETLKEWLREAKT